MDDVSVRKYLAGLHLVRLELGKEPYLYRCGECHNTIRSDKTEPVSEVVFLRLSRHGESSKTKTIETSMMAVADRSLLDQKSMNKTI